MGSIETYRDIVGTECVRITTSQDVYIPSPSLLVSPVSYIHTQTIKVESMYTMLHGGDE